MGRHTVRADDEVGLELSAVFEINSACVCVDVRHFRREYEFSSLGCGLFCQYALEVGSVDGPEAEDRCHLSTTLVAENISEWIASHFKESKYVRRSIDVFIPKVLRS